MLYRNEWLCNDSTQIDQVFSFVCWSGGDFFFNPMCGSLWGLLASSYLFQTTFYIKKNLWLSSVVFNTYIFLPYSHWHSDMYQFHKTHHVNHSIYF